MKTMWVICVGVLTMMAGKAMAEVPYFETLQGKYEVVQTKTGEKWGEIEFKPEVGGDSQGEFIFEGTFGDSRTVERCEGDYEVGNRTWLVKTTIDLERFCGRFFSLSLVPELKNPSPMGTHNVLLLNRGEKTPLVLKKIKDSERE